MTASSRTEEVYGVDQYDRMVTPEFAPLADFAGFGAYEAIAVQETGQDIPALTQRITAEISRYLMTHPESAPLMSGSHQPINELVMKKWLDRTIAGPFDGDLADFLRRISHLPGSKVTFPGLQIPLPPQMILALTAWMQGRILKALGETFDTNVVSAAGAAWMNQSMLQLGIILE
ncbi:MAG TPA: protoglobin domain-containing protein, partial [Pseudonocardiaceae bacterium]|nr:protoglobin domain-containing protein [Pseudonocardiaceae bacterium]